MPADTVDDRIATLERELAAMRAAAEVKEDLIAQGYAQMDVIIEEVEQRAREIEVASSEATAARGMLQRILNTMDEALMVVSSDGVVIEVNERFGRLVGLTREAVLGTTPERFFAREELVALARDKGVELPSERAVASLFAHPDCRELHGSLVADDGARLAHIFRSDVLRDAHGKKAGVVIVGSDVRVLHEAFASLERAHAGMRLVLDNIHEGLMSVGLDGRVAPECSARVPEWFGETAGRLVWDVFDTYQPGFGEAWEMAYEQLVTGFLPFEVCLHQMPTRLVKDEQHLQIAIRGVFEGDTLQGTIVVVSDISSEIAAARAEAERQQFLDMLERVVRDREAFEQFASDACELVEQLGATGDPGQQFRLVHTLKGNASLFGLKPLVEVCHGVESRLSDDRRPLDAEEQTAIEREWDDVVARLGGLVTGTSDQVSVPDATLQAFLDELKERDLRDLIQIVDRWRHRPVEVHLRRLAMHAERIANSLGKRVVVRVESDDLRLPGEVYGPFWSNLIHVLRNAIDHGLEPAGQRVTAGKGAAGNLTIRATRRGEGFGLAIEDDGRGIDWTALRRRARERGVEVPAGEEPPITALFADGVSTREAADELSGRGVGMAAVRAAVEALGGTIRVESRLGRGTRFAFGFPARGGSS